MKLMIQNLIEKNTEDLSLNDIKKQLETINYTFKDELNMILKGLELENIKYVHNIRNKNIKLISNFFLASIENGIATFKSYDRHKLEKYLNELEKQGIIYCDQDKNKYRKMPDNYCVVEVKSSKKGILYCELNEEKYYLSSDDFKHVLLFDLIIVKKNKNNIKFDKIINRNESKIVGEITIVDAQKTIIPFNMDKDYPFIVKKQNLKTYVEGDRILIELETEMQDGYFNGKVVKYLGNKKDMNQDFISICASYGFRYGFSKETKEELKDIPTEIIPEDLDNRFDLRSEVTYTIDGIDAMDLDDAISVQRTKKGGYILKVHIAHVSHYIKYDSAIFQDALINTTSIYTPGAVNPMFPHQISSGICSLQEKQDRLVRTVEIEYDKFGNRIDFIIYPAIINSQKKMCYDNVNLYFEKDIVSPGYEPFTEDLDIALNLSERLSSKKFHRGYIGFENDEVVFSLDEDGNPIAMNLKERGKAQELIENFMIEANECVAIHAGTLPFPYRNNGFPSQEKLKFALKGLKNMGIKIPEIEKLNNHHVLQKILMDASSQENSIIILRMILFSLQKAYYSPNNIGHFGLALDNYTHFTSPVRRINDYMVHYLIDLYEQDNLTDKKLHEIYKILESICLRASTKERDADLVSYQTEKLQMAKYMENKIGEEYEMFILKIQPNHVVVTAKGLIEGKVLLSDFINDSVTYNHNKNFLNSHSGWTYKIGHKVAVQVKEVSLIEPNVYFYITDCFTKNESKEARHAKRRRKKKNQ